MKFKTIEESIKNEISSDLPETYDPNNPEEVYLRSIAKSLIIIRNEIKYIRMKT